ncbi:DUF2129 domain-containing protein [Streptococcus sp. DD12]|uniref:DUF2129 domain-containing protein n=1 Tax=Streptococcus sp. DD12 TaxID=1777880 RepID=UPI000791CDD8|nr:DUF2129 domain-containing protein [Streptococcus sp. DD12]KXT75649.1 hypothetical protein STRDD12_00761 [Streptococcus sp. DD12]
MLALPTREKLIVYLKHRRDIRKIRKFGDCLYQSQAMNYVVLYVDAEKYQTTIDKLEALPCVTKVLPSYYKEVDRDFVGSLERDN